MKEKSAPQKKNNDPNPNPNTGFRLKSTKTYPTQPANLSEENKNYVAT